MDLRAPTGQYLLKPLFWETSTPTSRKKFTPLYTMKEHDHVDAEGTEYKSAYQIYMECVDEDEAAIKLLGSRYHWDKLKNCKWFQDGIMVDGAKTTMGLEDWRKHKQADIESNTLGKLWAQAGDGNLQAIKYLHQHYAKKPTAKRGPKHHPTKNAAEDELADNIAMFANRDRG